VDWIHLAVKRAALNKAQNRSAQNPVVMSPWQPNFVPCLSMFDHLEEPGVDGRIILRWIFRKWDVGVWTGSSWLRIVTGGGHL